MAYHVLDDFHFKEVRQYNTHLLTILCEWKDYCVGIGHHGLRIFYVLQELLVRYPNSKKYVHKSNITL